MTTKFHLPRASFASILRRAVSVFRGAPALLVVLGLAASPAAKAQIGSAPIFVGVQTSVHGPSYPTLWQTPIGAASDSYGNVYIGECTEPSIIEIPAGSNHSSVYISTSQQIATPVAPHTAQALGCVSMLAMDSSNNLYIADTNNSRIIEWSTTSNTLVAVYSTGAIFPFAITLDGSGNIWYGGTNSSYLGQIGVIPAGSATYTAGTPDTNITNLGTNNTAIGPQLPQNDTVTGLVVVCTRKGLFSPVTCDLLASDTYTNNVFEYTYQNGTPGPTGADLITHYTSTHESTDVSGGNPYGLALDANGDIWVAESSTNGGEVFEYVPTVILGVTTGYTPYPVVANITDVEGIAFTPSGDIFLTSDPGSAVTEISPKIDFGTKDIGKTSHTLYLDLSIPNHTTITSLEALDQGANPKEFSLTVPMAVVGATPETGGPGTICSDVLTGTTSTVALPCQVELTFTPSYPGNRPGAVAAVGTHTGTGSFNVYDFMSGVGRGPEIQFNPGAATTTVDSGSLTQPEGVAADAFGDVFIANTNAGSVIEVPFGGSPVTIASGLTLPTGLAVDGAGDLFVAESGSNSRVDEYPWNSHTLSFGGRTTVGSGFSAPYSVAVDDSGNLFVADEDNNRIVELPYTGTLGFFGFTPGFGTAITVASGLDRPTGVAVDSNDDVFVAEYYDAAVVEFPWNGSSWGSPVGIGSGWNTPSGIAVDANDDVYVADQGNRQVTVWYDGAYTTWSVLANETVNGLASPTGVALDGLGNVYIADQSYSAGIYMLNLASPPTLTWPTPTPYGVIDYVDGHRSFTIANIGTENLGFLSPGSGVNPVITAGFENNPWGHTTCPVLTDEDSSVWTGPGSDPGTYCTYAVDFIPDLIGPNTGTLTLTDDNLHVWEATQVVDLNGTGIKKYPHMHLTSSANPIFIVTTPVTFTATVDGTLTNPTGTVTFYDLTTSTTLGTVPLVAGSGETSWASVTVTSFAAPAENHTIEATYNPTADVTCEDGCTPYTDPYASVNAWYHERTQDFTIALAPGSPGSQNVLPGFTLTYGFLVSPTNGSTFPADVLLTSSGYPTGATSVLTPSTVSAGSTATVSVLTITPLNTTVSTNNKSNLNLGRKLAPLSLALLLLPFVGFRRGRKTWQRYLALILLLGGSLAAAAGLSACTSASGYFGQAPATFTVTVTGTNTGPSGTLTHSTSVTLNLE